MRDHWWEGESGIAVCPEPGCGCPIQRTTTGTVADGMKAHYGYVHPGKSVPAQVVHRTP